MDENKLRELIAQALEEYILPKVPDIAPKWKDGQCILQPADGSAAKEIPLDVFFKKITGMRENLRVLEQKINNHPNLGAEDKASLQGYITKCYGSMTTFNVLFRNSGDRFIGAGKSGSGSPKQPNMSIGEAKRRLGLSEHGND